MFQLMDVTLMISVYAKRNMKKNEMVGWFSLGLNSSGPDEVAHWMNMRDTAKGELLARWHVLVDSWFEELGQTTLRVGVLGLGLLNSLVGGTNRESKISKNCPSEQIEAPLASDENSVAVDIDSPLEELDFV